jgi:hypothetical protein
MRVTACPVCGQTGREELYADLDDAGFASPESWTLYRCSACGSAYLDPRPTGAALAAAYATYYTHESPAVGRRLAVSRRFVSG